MGPVGVDEVAGGGHVFQGVAEIQLGLHLGEDLAVLGLRGVDGPRGLLAEGDPVLHLLLGGGLGVGLVEEPGAAEAAFSRVSVISAGAGGIQLGLHHHHVVVVHAVEPLDVVLVLVLAELQDAVVLAVEVDHGEVGVGHLDARGVLGDEFVGNAVAEQGGAVGVGGGGKEGVVTAVAEDEAIVLVQDLPRVLARDDGALGEKGVGEGAQTHVGLVTEVAVLAGDDLEGFLGQGAGGAAEEAKTHVLGDDTGAVGGQDLGVGGPLHLGVDVAVHGLEIVLVTGEHDGVVEALGGVSRDVGMSDDLARQLAVGVKAGGADGHALPLVGGDLDGVLILGGTLGGNRAVGGVADGIALGGGDLHGLGAGGVETAHLREDGVDLRQRGAVTDEGIGGLGGNGGVGSDGIGGSLGIGGGGAVGEGQVTAVFGGLGRCVGGVCIGGGIPLVTGGQPRGAQKEEGQQEGGGAGGEISRMFHGGVLPFHIDFQFIIPHIRGHFGDGIENI